MEEEDAIFEIGEHDPESLSEYDSTMELRTIAQIKRGRLDLDKRYVFLCPTSLAKHFAHIPPQTKDLALLVFKSSREWFFRDPADILKSRSAARVDNGATKEKKKVLQRNSPENQTNLLRAHSNQNQFPREFMQWVVQKELDKCVFWFKPEKDLQKLSRFFEEQLDPVTAHPYKPLLLDPWWWRIRFSMNCARYVGSPVTVVSSISMCSVAGIDHWDFDTHALQELIYQSNPSLEPLIKWPHAPSMRYVPHHSHAQKHNEAYKGYINQDLPVLESYSSVPAGVKSLTDKSRISAWPEVPSTRLDNLHHHWQVEDSAQARRTLASFVSRPASRPMTSLKLAGHTSVFDSSSARSPLTRGQNAGSMSAR